MIRIGFLTSQPPEAVSGNNTTLRRLLGAFERLSVESSAFSLAGREEDEVLADLRARGVDLVHAIHAFKAGPAARRIAERLGVPYVVSVTGTDLHLDARDPARRAAVASVLRGASAVIAGRGAGLAEVLGDIGVEGSKVTETPKGVELPDRAEVESLFEAESGPVAARIRFLLPAGFRRVKNNLFPLKPLAEVRREIPEVSLRFVGPVIEPRYRERFRPSRFPFAEDGGTVPPESMGGEYRAAAVVLNVSHSEGGANAVLEAMAWGRPVLASDIQANRAFLRFDEDRWEESTGVLYRTRPSRDPRRRIHDAADFAARVRRLARDPGLRRAIGRAARAAAEREHSPEAEARAILAAYGRIEPGGIFTKEARSTDGRDEHGDTEVTETHGG